ncbi:MAG: GAF domain-containing protein, partial [Candidatus Methanoplasma sp.]|nr:GAF domain-containing protein [Candidatus Methanoplasma sp.]
PIIYDFNSTGIWGEPIRQGKPIIVNDYPNEASEYKKGVPHGHVPLNRLMMIPIYHNGKAIATAGVGNKTQEYTSDDLMQFTLLMDGLMSIYHERMLERENIKSERNLKEILQNAPVGVILVDNDLTIEVDNDYARSLLSTHSLCLSKDPLKANSNELSRLISNDIEKARESRYGLEFEHTIESGNQIFVFKVNVAKTKGTNNEDTGFTIIIDDISELALASRQHITAVERINLLDSLINDDIRELLAKIEKEIDNIGESDSADKIKGSVEALKGIMAFVKEYHDVGILEPQWQYLDDVLDYAVKVIKMDGRSVKYNVKGIRVFADPAFYNVFSQFMEYSRTNCRNTPECSIKCRLDDGDLIIRYSDNSAGIPYKKKQDFVSGRMIEYGRGAYLAFNILKACGFGVSESGIPDEEMVIEITIPQPKYSISWE